MMQARTRCPWRTTRTSRPIHPLAATKMSPHASIETLHKAALLHRHPQGEQMDLSLGDALNASCADLHSLSPSQLSTLLWSVCRLEMKQASECQALANFVCQTPQALLDHDPTTSELSICLWSMVRLKDLISYPARFKYWFKVVIKAVSQRAYELRASDITCH